MTKVKHLLIGIFFSLTISISGQTNQYHEDGTRHGLWEKKYENTDQIRYSGNFDHGVEIGEFKYYLKGFPRQVSAIKKFSDQGKKAEIIYFSQNGKPISKGILIDKKREGKWEYFHNNSDRIMMEEYYTNGLLEGERISYYDNKQKSETVQFVKGKKEGKSYVYSLKGVVLKEYTYINDLLDGVNKYFNGKGELLIEGQYVKDKKQGIWNYYENGVLVKTKHYK